MASEMAVRDLKGCKHTRAKRTFEHLTRDIRKM